MNQDTRSRWAGMSRVQACAVLLALLLALLAALPRAGVGLVATGAAANGPANADLHLYRTINARLAAGEPYYAAVARTQREQDYPLRPFITLRLPTLALVSVALGPVVMTGMIWALMLALLIIWWRRLEGAYADPKRRVTGLLLLASGLTLAARPELIVVHEIWAGLLIALSLGPYRPDRYWPALLAAALALAIRELALPYVLLMGALALWQRDWRQAGGWAMLCLGFGVLMVWHALQVAAEVVPGDPASQGWAQIGGLPMALRALRMTSALRALPEIIALLLIVLSLFGWISWRGGIARAGALLLLGFTLLLSLLGRPENFYWALIVSPLLLLGLGFVPQAMGDLWRGLRAAR